MKSPFVRRVPVCSLFLLSIFLLATISVRAQAQTDYAAPAQTAKGEGSAHILAYRQYGVIQDREMKGEVLGGALYVKLRSGYDGISAAESVARLLARAGLSVQATSSLGGLDVPLDKSVQERYQVMSVERRQQAVQGEQELGRIIEVCYGNDIHPRRAAAMLESMNEVEYAEPVFVPHLLSPQEPNDPRIPNQKQLTLVKAFEAWNIWAGDTATIIGVVDAGINMFHEDLWPNIAPNFGESGLDGSGKDKASNGLDDDGNGVIDDWKGANLSYYLDGTAHGNTVGSEHGTQVSGYAAAATDNGIGIAGIANQCRFFPVKTASSVGGGLVEAYNGVLYCARRGFQVINCSWGDADYSQAEQDIVKNVTLAYDAAIIAGAGNDYQYQVLYPAGYRYVMGVGGINEQGQYVRTWGEQVDISCSAGLTTSGTTDYYDLESVTSYTTPIVSGIVALVRSHWPNLNARQAMAHVRLLADNIDGFNLDKAGLVGYGKANALKALSVDPFSHPGLIVDSVWVTDEAGNPKANFGLGERGVLWFGVTNVLGKATSTTARIARYTDDSAAIRFDPSPLQIGTLESGSSWITPQGVPFEVIAPSQGLTRIRIDFQADDYSDYAYEFQTLYRPYTVYQTPRLSLTLTESGRLGFDYRSFGPVGEGVVFDTRSSLYEGGLIVAEDRDHVLDNVRADDLDQQDEDFTLVETPLPTNDFTLTLNDSKADPGRRIGIELRMKVVTVDTVANAVGIQVRAKNNRPATIDSLRVGLFCDWDLDGISPGQNVEYIAGPTGRIAFHGLISNPSGSRLASGVAGPVPYPAFYAIRNNTDPLSIEDGFDKGEKWRTLSNGIGNANSGTGDVSLVTGSVLTNLEPGEEDTVLFVFGFSSFTNEEALDGMVRFLGNPVSGAASDKEKKESDMILSLRPNPASRSVVVHLSSTLPHDVTLHLYGADGREVRDLTSFLGRRSGGEEFEVDLSDIPSGLYYVRLERGTMGVSQPVLIVR